MIIETFEQQDGYYRHRLALANEEGFYYVLYEKLKHNKEVYAEETKFISLITAREGFEKIKKTIKKT